MRISNRGSIPLWRHSVLLVIAAILLGGCSQHPKATSKESLEFIKQVYTACNTKNQKRLAECVERLAELESEGKVSGEEITSFKKVLEMAGEGEWESAQTMALRFASDQVR
ncbi:hypothetical protein VN12_05575 [Pirellula sp. SH-Sr6A]|uniref:hypothetical protein n=1 Tax=Pirellula sp. SH-Sr6A TaxID=1632865 RepID=UPI00078D2333|nr:hypothetical protein [Pirellula sp. SH-Sr6A]AMV31568.1 hypothetical protein VN12_05575 [Pirellula sp. SH-Sr6A]